MIKIFTDLFKYIQNPILEKDSNTSFLYRLSVFTVLLIFSYFVVFFFLIILGVLTTIGFIEQGEHVFDDIFEENSALQVFLLASVMAPFFEELIFRGPLIFFKNPKTFKLAFFGFAILFGYVHLFNFKMSINVLLFSPILVAPQIYLGFVLGYIRVKFGLHWSMFMHAVYNGILVSISLLAIDALKQ
tara:strand:+ start:31534 stop:32094 length:561 start_codon:yes stop_codon:yes gene_type:complete